MNYYIVQLDIYILTLSTISVLAPEVNKMLTASILPLSMALNNGVLFHYTHNKIMIHNLHILNDITSSTAFTSAFPLVINNLIILELPVPLA